MPPNEFLALGARAFIVVSLGQRGSDARLIGFAPGVGIGRLAFGCHPKNATTIGRLGKLLTGVTVVYYCYVKRLRELRDSRPQLKLVETPAVIHQLGVTTALVIYFSRWNDGRLVNNI